MAAELGGVAVELRGVSEAVYRADGITAPRHS